MDQKHLALRAFTRPLALGTNMFNQDSPWVGLIYCNYDHWMACKESGKPSTLRSGDPNCVCQTSFTPAFTDTSPIQSSGRLPLTPGGSIEWIEGFLPTSTTSSLSSSSTVSSSGSSSNSTIPTPTAAPSVAPLALNNISPDLSTGAKVGIGLGAFVGFMMILGGLSAGYTVFRRNRRNGSKSSGESELGQTGNPKAVEPVEMPTPVVGELGSEDVTRPWSLCSEQHDTSVMSHLSGGSQVSPVSPSAGAQQGHVSVHGSGNGIPHVSIMELQG
jgi:hypothetical protein